MSMCRAKIVRSDESCSCVSQCMSIYLPSIYRTLRASNEPNDLTTPERESSKPQNSIDDHPWCTTRVARLKQRVMAVSMAVTSCRKQTEWIWKLWQLWHLKARLLLTGLWLRPRLLGLLFGRCRTITTSKFIGQHVPAHRVFRINKILEPVHLRRRALSVGDAHHRTLRRKHERASGRQEEESSGVHHRLQVRRASGPSEIAKRLLTTFRNCTELAPIPQISTEAHFSDGQPKPRAYACVSWSL